MHLLENALAELERLTDEARAIGDHVVLAALIDASEIILKALNKSR